MDYHQSWDIQRRLATERAEAGGTDTLLLLEHPHVYTTGRRSQEGEVLLDERGLGDLGVQVVEADRGGQVTYHGPGQLVGYPIISLTPLHIGPRQYIRTLEQMLIRTLADFGIQAHVEPGLTGVWVYAAKVAAIGVKLSKGVTMHGFSLNVEPDLDYYQHIVPCGIYDRGVTSMSRLLGYSVPMDAVRKRVASHFGESFGLRLEKAFQPLAV
jgi:lipoate-protein ligase B